MTTLTRLWPVTVLRYLLAFAWGWLDDVCSESIYMAARDTRRLRRVSMWALARWGYRCYPAGYYAIGDIIDDAMRRALLDYQRDNHPTWTTPTGYVVDDLPF